MKDEDGGLPNLEERLRKLSPEASVYRNESSMKKSEPPRTKAQIRAVFEEALETLPGDEVRGLALVLISPEGEKLRAINRLYMMQDVIENMAICIKGAIIPGILDAARQASEDDEE